MDYVNLKEEVLNLKKEPLAGDNLTNLFRLLIQNRFKIDIRYLPRMLYSIPLSTLIAPFRVMERRKFDETINKTEIKRHPIFLLGHWRGGTTYLHNTLSMDKNLGYCSTFHAYLPGAFLGFEKLLKPIVASSLPKKRPMDDVAMGADLPQEDEYAIGALSPYSYYHGWCFPKNMEFYNKFVCMEDVSKRAIDKWKEVYMYFLKKVTIREKGKRLILKNPANTARIKLLLEMFPDAKFIHIQRNPYHQYLSMMRFMRIVIPLYCVQKPPKIGHVEKLMMDLYVDMYRKYFRERKRIPEGNFVEVKYEDFIERPFEELRRIYGLLNLAGFKKSERAFRAYILSQSEVRLHNYVIDAELREKIYKKWGFAFKEFGYEA